MAHFISFLKRQSPGRLICLGFAAVILNGDWIVRLEHAIEA